uniref:Uncharacterized protein n=1 Tax=Anguilla anguilla TaxID=7936 RepID=A0A0E9WLJ8_ANGAN
MHHKLNILKRHTTFISSAQYLQAEPSLSFTIHNFLMGLFHPYLHVPV